MVSVDTSRASAIPKCKCERYTPSSKSNLKFEVWKILEKSFLRDRGDPPRGNNGRLQCVRRDSKIIILYKGSHNFRNASAGGGFNRKWSDVVSPSNGGPDRLPWSKQTRSIATHSSFSSQRARTNKLVIIETGTHALATVRSPVQLALSRGRDDRRYYGSILPVPPLTAHQFRMLPKAQKAQVHILWIVCKYFLVSTGTSTGLLFVVSCR